MQISSGNPSMSNNTQVITLDTFKKFLETRQMESMSDSEIKMIIEVIRHESDFLCFLKQQQSKRFLEKALWIESLSLTQSWNVGSLWRKRLDNFLKYKKKKWN